MPNIIEINSLSHNGLEPYVKLTEAQLRNRLEPELGIFIAESPTVIRLALDAGIRPVSMLMERRHIYGDAAELIKRCGDIPIYTGERDILNSLTGYRLTRGVLSAMRRPAEKDWRELVKDARRVAILEDVADASNVGAIIRSAAALNIDAVLLSPGCCDPLNRRAARVSMGTVFQIPWARIEADDGWPVRTLGELGSFGFKSAAMALTDISVSVDTPEVKENPRLAILLGTEGTGLRKETIASCDYTVKIPMSHGVDSLNVAAASAVAFWALRDVCS